MASLLQAAALFAFDERFDGVRKFGSLSYWARCTNLRCRPEKYEDKFFFNDFLTI